MENDNKMELPSEGILAKTLDGLNEVSKRAHVSKDGTYQTIKNYINK